MLLNNIKAVIFDLDGTLIDSLDIWHNIDIEYLNSKNIEMPPNLKKEIGHLSFAQTAHYFKKRFNITDSTEEMMQTWNDMAFEFYSHSAPLKKGAKEFLEFLKSNHIKIGLATSNSSTLLEAALKSNDVYHLFNSITMTSEVDKGKDHPDVYLLAASRLNTPPTQCLVFEDILPAIKGATLAGMKTVGVEDSHSSDDKSEIIKLSTTYIKDYLDLLP